MKSIEEISETPMLDQLESGPWPSFVSDMKRHSKNKKACLCENPLVTEYINIMLMEIKGKQNIKTSTKKENENV